MRILKDFDELLGDVTHWQLTAPDVFSAYATNAYGAVVKYTFSAEELEQHHKQLPGIILGLIEARHKNGRDPHADGINVCESLRLHQSGGITFSDTDGYPVLLSVVRMITRLTSTGHYCIDGHRVVVSKYVHNGESIELVTWRKRDDFVVTKNELDTKFPGWEERLRIGSDLGVDYAQLMNHVFAKPSTPEEKPSLSGLSFE